MSILHYVQLRNLLHGKTNRGGRILHYVQHVIKNKSLYLMQAFFIGLNYHFLKICYNKKV